MNDRTQDYPANRYLEHQTVSASLCSNTSSDHQNTFLNCSAVRFWSQLGKMGISTQLPLYFVLSPLLKKRYIVEKICLNLIRQQKVRGERGWMSRSKWPEVNRGCCSKDFSFQDIACKLHQLQKCPSDALQSAICEPMTLSPVHCLSYVGPFLQVLTPAYREHHTTLPYWGALTCSSNHHTLETFKVTPILTPDHFSCFQRTNFPKW